MTAKGFDWPALMRFGVQTLGLKPEEFWRLTPAEFLLIANPSGGQGPMVRAQFEALAARFPDLNTDLEEGLNDRNS